MLSAGSAALQAFNEATAALTPDQEIEPRKVSVSPLRYWPIATASVSCLVCTISAIGMAVLGNGAMACMQGAAAISSAVTLIYLIYVGPYKKVEAIASFITKGLKELTGGINELNHTSKATAQHNKDLRKELKQEQALAKEARQALEKNLRDFTSSSQHLENAAQKMADISAALKNPQKLCTTLSKQIPDLEEAAQTLQTAEGNATTLLNAILTLQRESQESQRMLVEQQGQVRSLIPQIQRLIDEFRRSAEEAAAAMTTREAALRTPDMAATTARLTQSSDQTAAGLQQLSESARRIQGLIKKQT